MRTRYAVTVIGHNGLRTFVGANQGRNHFDTPIEAHAHMRAMLENNSAERLASIYGANGAATFGVSPIECYDNGDAVGCYPDDTCDETGNVERASETRS